MSRRLYRLLLLMLPGWFREEFGREMTQAFVDSRGSLLSNGRDLAALGMRLHGEALRQDLVYAFRTLRQTPTFTIAAIATLAVAWAPRWSWRTFFTRSCCRRCVRSVRPARAHVACAPREKPDSRAAVDAGLHGLPRETDGVRGLCGAHRHQRRDDHRQHRRARSPASSTSDLHDVLRVHPILGRGLETQDEAPGAPPVMVLGQSLWQTEFGGRRDVVGTHVKVDGADTTIVGVLPEGIDFPAGSTNAWVPLTLDPANASRATQFLNGTARLKPGVTLAQAQDTMNGLAKGLAEAYPDTNAGKSVELFGLKEQINGDAPRLIVVLSAAIAAVLLIACLNVASLLTVRASMRASELAVRTALGATGRRLRRQLMVEHMLLAAGGGALAIPLGLALHRTIVEKRLLSLPRTATGFGWEPVAALGILVVLIGVALAWIAIRRSSTSSASSTLLGSVRQTGGRGLVRLRQGLVIAEVAATLILLVTAGLMLESARRLAAVDPGFRTENVLTFGVVLPGQTYMEPKNRLSFATRVVDGLKALPGVSNATIGGYAPMGDMRGTRRFARADQPPPASGQEPVALDLPVGADYFSVMGIDVKEGRAFTERDGPDAPPVMIVSDAFATANFPGESAIGRKIRFFSSRPGGTPPPTREIVGVVSDVRQDGMSVKPIPHMYAPYAQNAWGFLTFFILTDGDPTQVSASVQRVVTAVDPERPARDVLTTQAIVRGSTERTRAISWMLLTLAGLAILLAMVGLYGIVATAGAARSREIAIRAAIGAQPGSLLRLVLGQALIASAIGVAIGVGGSLAVTQGLGSLLYEVPAKDPLILLGTSGLLLLVSAVAGYLPARRAMVENPAQVLRTD